MIILVENKEDRIALGKIYDWIDIEIEEKGIDFIETKPIYDARIINIEKEPQA